MKLLTKLARGQMLIEIVVAVGIIGLVLVGVSDLMTRSSRVITFQKQKDEAQNIAQRLLTQYRIQRDSNPQNFYNTVISTEIDPCEPGKAYKCNVTIVKAVSAVMITVKVTWSEGGQNLDISLYQTLAKDQK